jgi:hypothetical protein
MKKDRSNWTVRKFSSFAEAEEADIDYWAAKSTKQRLTEATEWIEQVWAMHKKMHGEWESLPDGKHVKSQVDKDDF